MIPSAASRSRLRNLNLLSLWEALGAIQQNPDPESEGGRQDDARDDDTHAGRGAEAEALSGFAALRRREHNGTSRRVCGNIKRWHDASMALP